MPLVDEYCMPMMNTFEPFTETDIRQLLKRLSNALYAVAAMHTLFMKECLEVLITPIRKKVNTLLTLGIFPKSMKSTLVRLLVKTQFSL